MADSTPFPVLVHPFKSPTPNSCAYERGASPTSENALVFVGGLGDGPHTVAYVRAIAEQLQKASGVNYSTFEVRLGSSFGGFGYKSLKDDVADISALVAYLRGIGKKKVVLMGHSTGCQDCLEYTDYEKHKNVPVDGFILQGPVSDREGLIPFMGAEKWAESVAYAEQLIKEGRQDECMPQSKLPVFYTSPTTAYRYFSLAGKGGDDDYFSSDLADDKLAAVWGRVKQPLLIVPSEKDQYVPEHVDVPKLVARWTSFCPPGTVSDLSGLIPGADHAVTAEGKEWLADRVVKFLQEIGR